MKPPQNFRYGEVNAAACRFLIASGVRSLPVNPFDIIAGHGWGLIAYSEIALRMGIGFDEMLACAASLDGFTLCRGGRYTIAYNNRISAFGRIVFTLMHEAGHIVLGHFEMAADYRGSTRGSRIQEQEANYFASCVMAPFAVIRECELTTVESLRGACGLSYQAARRRLGDYRRWVEGESDRALLRQLGEYTRVTGRSHAVMAAAEIERG